MNNIGEILESHIKSIINDNLKEKVLPDVEYIETDNLGEIIEKLIILHIRIWMLEDKSSEVKNDTDLADIKRKIDTCFKIKRPKYIQAINLLVENAILKGKSLKEDSVKLYK
jgi:hypothetical protein